MRFILTYMPTNNSFFGNEMSLNRLSDACIVVIYLNVIRHGHFYTSELLACIAPINALPYIPFFHVRITASTWFYLWHGSQAISPSLYDLCEINSIGLSVYITFMNHPSCSLRYILLSVKK